MALLLLWLCLLVATLTDGQPGTLPANCLGVLGGINCNADGSCTYTASYAVQQDDSVTFIVSAWTPANTWVGLAVSDDQFMVNSDVVLGAADGTNSFIHDRFAFEQAEPPVDDSQDIESASAEHVDGVTTITFNRPRNSGDTNDISLDECRFFLFAFGGRVSFFATPPISIYHGFGPTRRVASAERICIPTFTECSMVIGFERSTYSVEEGLQVEVCVIVINSTPSREVIVTLSSSDVDAEAPGDYTAIAEDLTFSASETRICRNVIPAEDDILEEDEDFLLTLATSDSNVVLRPSEATVSILNDDNLIIGFERTTYSVEESLQMEVCVIIINNILSREVIVTLSSSDVDAEAPGDYTAIAEDLTFSASETRICRNVIPAEDDILEEDEDFLLTLATSDSNVVLRPSEATVSILNDDNLLIGFERTTYSVEESLQMEVCVIIINNILSREVIVILSSSDVDAEAPGDYTAIAEDLTFSASETRICRNVIPAEDDILEEDEDFLLTLATSDSNVVLRPSEATVSILNDDTVTIGFEHPQHTATEEIDASVEVCALVLSGTFEREVIVTFFTTDGNATSVDYTTVRMELTFSAGNFRNCRNIAIKDDHILEDPENLFANLTTSNPYVVLEPNVTEVLILERQPSSAKSGSAAIIGAVVVGTSILLILIGVVILLLIFVCKKYKNSARFREGAVASTRPIALNNAVYEAAAKKELVYEDIADRRGQKKEFNSVNANKWREVFAGKILEPSQVEYQQLIGEGAFGKIFRGRIITISPRTSSVAYTEVAIRTLNHVTSDKEVEDFMAESAIMLDFHHPNVLSLVGIIFDTTDHLPVVVLPFMAHGDLRSYLRSKRISTSSRLPAGLTEKMLLEMCLDIAKGMQYLSTLKFVHRDLAARKCMVDQALGVKVSDFGMSREVYHSNYYRLTHKARLPVRWMPPESIFNSIFNEKTDVWSFGVTCWEVFSLGCEPFSGIDNVDIPQFISRGHRLKKPTLCSSGMYAIMMETWSDNPEGRPTFQKLVASLASLYQSTGGLNHHYHILNAPTITVGERDGAPDAQYHVLEGPTAIPPVSGSAVNEHRYAVLEGPTPNPETSHSTYSEINDTRNDSSARNPNEYEIPLQLPLMPELSKLIDDGW